MTGEDANMAETRHERRGEKKAEARSAREPRLDQPRDERRVTLRPTYDSEAFGRVSEKIARFLGTARYLVYQTVLVIIWVIYNLVVPHSSRFDKYPFIFLTLILSLQAAYAAPLILLAQNRQDDRDRVNLEQDRAGVAQQRADTEFVARELAAVRIALGDVVTRDFLRSELRAILEELDGDGATAKSGKKKKAKSTAPAPGATRASAPAASPPPADAQPDAQPDAQLGRHVAVQDGDDQPGSVPVEPPLSTG
jgi:uncharacterized membrane protein